MRFVLSRCYVFRNYIRLQENSRATIPDLIFRYKGFTVDFVPLREGFYLRRVLGGGVFEMRTTVPWCIMCIHMWCTRSGAERSIKQYVTQNNR